MTDVNAVSSIEGFNTGSARSVLLTILGEFVRPDGGAAWTSTIIDAMAVLGIEEGASRQALARSGTDGLLVAERIGRRTRWKLTERGRQLLDDGADRIYGFGIGTPEWDGRWLLVLTTIPEHRRHLRGPLRARLAWLGFGSLGPGTWVSPWVAHEPEVANVLLELGLTAGSLSWIGQPGTLGAVQDRAAQIWGTDILAAEYLAFQHTTATERPNDSEASFAALIRLVHSWRHFPAIDPGLPASLLPGTWPRANAALLFRDRREKWSPPAWEWWHEHSSR